MSQKNQMNPDVTHEDPYYQRVLGPSDQQLLVDDLNTSKKNLTKEVERLSRLVSEKSTSLAVTRDCDALLDQARANLAGDQPETSAASRNLHKVKRRLLTAHESRKTWPKWVSGLLVLNFVFLVGFGLFIGLFTLIPGQKNMENTAFVCLACAMWGGLGGVIDAFIALYLHTSRQDFDLHFRTWYFVHPIQGAALGAVVYLFIQAGLLATTGSSLQETTSANITETVSSGAVSSNIGATALPLVIAFLAGFKQNKVRRFLTRIVTAIFEKPPQSDSEE